MRIIPCDTGLIADFGFIAVVKHAERSGVRPRTVPMLVIFNVMLGRALLVLRWDLSNLAIAAGMKYRSAALTQFTKAVGAAGIPVKTTYHVASIPVQSHATLESVVNAKYRRCLSASAETALKESDVVTRRSQSRVRSAISMVSKIGWATGIAIHHAIGLHLVSSILLAPLILWALAIY